MKKIYQIIISGILSIAGLSVSAQCPTIACPTNISVNNDAGTCGAIVNYTAPVGINTCLPQGSVTFNYAGIIDSWTVPAGVTSVRIEVRGAEGGNGSASTTSAGLGAIMIGDFNVTPATVLKVLVGGTGTGNGGGGGSFVTDNLNSPLIIAGGGGGSSQTMDSPDKHGNITTTGGTGAAGGGIGGTAGSGGTIGSSGFQSGAGGGLISNGSDGWTLNTGGLSFLNGGAGGSVGSGTGGFGGGGAGSGYVVGGGGGGYSGGGSGGNSSAGVGGGGASFNNGTNQNNTGAVNTGNGQVIITWGAPITPIQTAGLASGSIFPVGITTNTFEVSAGLETATCSFTVTVLDVLPGCSFTEWTGTTNTDWSTATNWNTGIVPTATDNVIIPDVSLASANFPVITPSTTLGDITVDAGASLTVNTGIVLDGTFTNNGTVTLKDGAYLDDFTNSGSSYVGNIIVETVAANGVSNDQRFISSPVNTPNVSEIGDDLVGPWGTGLPGANGVAITIDDCALATTTYTSNYGNLFEFNETIINTCEKDAWVVRSSGTLENARGYSAYLANGSTFEFEGTPNTGAQSIATTNTPSGVALGQGWNLIGNPYPSPISRDAVITAGASDAQYFVTSGVYQGTFSAYLPMSNIAVAQGFQVKVAASTTLNFDNSFRNTGASTWYQNNSWFDHKLEVSVFGNNGADLTTVYFNQEATNAYEAMYDVTKTPSNIGRPTLSTTNGAKKLGLNGMSINDLGETIPMNLAPGTDGNFSLKFEGMETFPANTTIYVKDLMLNTVHNIADGDYDFTSNTTDNVDRFEIIFVPELSFAITKVDCEGNYGKIQLEGNNVVADRNYEISNVDGIIYTGDLIDLNEELAAGNYEVAIADGFGGVQNYTITIESSETIEASLEVSNTEVFVGEMVLLNNTTANASNVIWSVEGSNISAVNNFTYAFETAGTYNIEMTVSNDECSDTKETIIEVSNKTTAIETLGNQEINFYPNPVSNILTIDTDANIEIELIDILGKRLIRTSEKTISVENIPTGVYFIKIFDETDTLIGSEKVIKK